VRPALITILTAVAAAALTLAAGLTPWIEFAYRSPSLHVALEAAAAIISGLAAYLVYGRFRESRRTGDLLLVSALAVFAFANLFFSAIPGTIGGNSVFETWAPLAARALGAVLFAASVIVPEISVRDPRRGLLLALGAATVALTAIGTAVALLGGYLPVGIDPALTPGTPERPFLEGHAALHAIQLALAALYAFAAVGFVRKSTRTGDELMTWFAVAAALSAFARVNYFLFPSLYSDWVYTGDLFRLGFYVVLLVGIAREIERYWRGLASVAVLEERRRIARDLHAGLAQELALIGMHSKSLADPRGNPVAAEIAAAADRALDESRRAIAALTRPLDEPLAAVLADVGGEVARREGVELDLVVRGELDVSPDTREELVRMVRNAIVDAAQHRGATRVRIEVTNGRTARLRISHDGGGSDPVAADTAASRMEIEVPLP
jgi:signal transduction histidine kinase